jgi:hypothetical protein
VKQAELLQESRFRRLQVSQRPKPSTNSHARWGIGAVGVIQSVMRRETIQCACLGNVFNLPMSKVTIIENLGMAAMAAWMLFAGM